MRLTLHPTKPYDEIILVDIGTRAEIPHASIDFETLEVDDAFAATASVIFLAYPKALDDEERAAYRRAVIAGNDFASV